MENNAHNTESAENRVLRFHNGDSIEIISTLLESINRYLNNELRLTVEKNKEPQTSLLIMGIHAAALTIGYGLFGKTPEDAYRAFLENFVDGDSQDTKFSEIAHEIHEWRNVLAHRWLNLAGHSIGYDFLMSEGWKKDGDVIVLNPKKYLECYLSAFTDGRIYNALNRILPSQNDREKAKARFLSKYIEPAVRT